MKQIATLLIALVVMMPVESGLALAGPDEGARKPAQLGAPLSRDAKGNIFRDAENNQVQQYNPQTGEFGEPKEKPKDSGPLSEMLRSLRAYPIRPVARHVIIPQAK